MNNLTEAKTMALVRSISIAISIAKQYQSRLRAIQNDTRLDRHDIKKRVKKILANNFRLNGEIVATATRQKIDELGFNVDNLERAIQTTTMTLEAEDVRQLFIIRSMIGTCDWMSEAATAIDRDDIETWLQKCPFKAPRKLEVANFTLCDKEFPITELALKQIIYMSLRQVEKDGFGDIPWRLISANPCIRGMLGVDDPDESISTSLEGKRIKWLSFDTMDKPLNEILEAGNKASKWLIFASKM
jgi:hypothetical protein